MAEQVVQTKEELDAIDAAAHAEVIKADQAKIAETLAAHVAEVEAAEKAALAQAAIDFPEYHASK
jgi:hypothetical protein